MTKLIHDPEVHRLGKLAPKPPRLMIRDYVDMERALPVVPATIDNTKGGSIALGMYLNDTYGDCTCAAIGNLLRVVSGGSKQLTDQDILTAYEAVTGFNPGPPPVNDNGAVELDVLDYWAKTGVGGDKLLGHAGVNMADPDEHRVVCALFGSVYLGVALAVEQQSQTVWDYVPGSSPGSWGGHAIPESAVNVDGAPFRVSGSGLIIVETWKTYKAVTPSFLAHQADEGHALVTDAWIAANVANPLVNAQLLAADLKQLAAER